MNAPWPSLEAWLDAVAEPRPTPGAGGAAGATVATAAALVAMAVRSGRAREGEVAAAGGPAAAGDRQRHAGVAHGGAAGPVQQREAIAVAADRLRERGLTLARDDAEAYAEVLATRPERERGQDRATEDEAHHRAWDHAAAVPLAITEAAGEVGQLAAAARPLVATALRGELRTALELARGAATAAAALVSIDTAAGRTDPGRIARAREVVATLARAELPESGEPQTAGAW